MHDHLRARADDGCGDGRLHVPRAALIHLANISYRLGRSLEFDPVGLRVIGDDEANGMLTKTYRAPFTLPELS